jgi:O-antigen/teichoic acid export membrane protein
MTERDTSKLSIGREAFLSVAAKALQVILGFIGIVVFTRVLGNDGLGRYRTVLAAAFILLTMTGDIAAVVKKRVAEIETESTEYLMIALVVHGGVTVVTMIGLSLGKSMLVPYFGSAELSISVGVITASVGFFTVLNYYQAGIGYPARSTWVDSLRSVLALGAQVGLLTLGYREFGVILGLVIASIISGTFLWFSLRPSVVVPTVETAKRTYAFARYSVPASLIDSLYGNATTLLINTFAGAGAVGFYSVASQFTQPAALLGSSISGVLGVKSSGIDSVGGDIRREIINSMCYIGLIAIPILFGALAISDVLMQADLFGKTYDDAPGMVLIGVALVQLINVYQRPFSSAIGASDRPDIILRVNLFAVFFYVPTAVGLGMMYDLYGVIGGAIIAESVRLISYQFMVARLFDVTVFPRPVGEQFFAGGVMFAVVEGLSQVVNANQLITLGSLIAIGAIVYFSILILVSRHFRKTLTRTLNQFQ